MIWSAAAVPQGSIGKIVTRPIQSFDRFHPPYHSAWMSVSVHAIYRYPVKGLTPEEQAAVQVTKSCAISNDRRFAFALGSTPIEGAVSDWMPKTNYLMLARNERMAMLDTSFDDDTDALTIFRGGKQVARGVLTTKIGRTMLEDFFTAFLGEECRGRPKLVEAAEGHTLSDHNAPVLSLINLASLKDMARVLGETPDPRRFRGNILIDGLDPWAEFDLVNKSLRIGDAVVKVKERIDRCAATNVNPESATRDMNIPKSLQQAFGHIECGVFATVEETGRIRKGDQITLID